MKHVPEFYKSHILIYRNIRCDVICMYMPMLFMSWYPDTLASNYCNYLNWKNVHLLAPRLLIPSYVFANVKRERIGKTQVNIYISKHNLTKVGNNIEKSNSMWNGFIYFFCVVLFLFGSEIILVLLPILINGKELMNLKHETSASNVNKEYFKRKFIICHSL